MTDKKQEVQYGVFTWGPCIVHLRISEAFHKLLLEEAQASRVKELDYSKKLAGVIKEEYMFRKKETFLPWISQILGIYDEAFQKHKNVFYKPEDKPNYLLSSLWVNFMKKNEFNPPHDHADELSFVIFLDVPPEITKEQDEYDGRSGGPGSLGFLYGEGNRQAITYQSVKPKNRDMFIFPAWVKHYVAPFYSDVTRISVSGNVASAVSLKDMKKYNEAKKIHVDKNKE
tara:strand:- start:50 stop:733 length:684 start_codon:yes stop_codon:yes gene_type:complete